MEFPSSLKLHTLPYTIVNLYTTEECNSLFGNDADPALTNTMRATINKLNNNQRVANPYKPQGTNITTSSSPMTFNNRVRINEECECCKTWGHNVWKNGCDFAAQYINTKKFLDANPNAISKILGLYKSHQHGRKVAPMRRNNFTKRFNDIAKNKRIDVGPKVKLLVKAIADTINADDEPTHMPASPTESEFDITLEQHEDQFRDTQDGGFNHN